MTVCCPLSGSDGDRATVSHTTCPVSARDKPCGECGKSIVRGEKYELNKSLWDGAWFTSRTCLLCVEIRDHFQCDGWIYGQLWDDLVENFFPDMKVGGPCMRGLSPQAKAALIDARLAWVFEHDEWEPEGFALPPRYQPQRPARPVPVDTRSRIAEFGSIMYDPMYPDDE